MTESSIAAFQSLPDGSRVRDWVPSVANMFHNHNGTWPPTDCPLGLFASRLFLMSHELQTYGNYIADVKVQQDFQWWAGDTWRWNDVARSGWGKHNGL